MLLLFLKEKSYPQIIFQIGLMLTNLASNHLISKPFRSVDSQSTNDQSSCFCWICYLDDEAEFNKTNEKPQNYSSIQPFNPCLCKGSLRYVHKHCLNLWVKEKYDYLTNSRSSNSLPAISCPNCKSLYNYTVKKSRNYCLSSFDNISNSFLETVALVILMFFQIILLTLDFRMGKSPAEDENQSEEGSVRISTVVQVVVGLIIVAAACYSAFRTYTTELQIEVQNKINLKYWDQSLWSRKQKSNYHC